MNNQSPIRDNATLQRMNEEALNRMADAELLRSSTRVESDSSYLLDLLAFEILLKACLIIDRKNGIENNRSHDYKNLFNRLSPETKNDLINTAATRMGPTADYSNLVGLLDKWSSNFKKLRYPYETYAGKTTKEFEDLGANWLQRGAQVDEAVFAYYPLELQGFLHALSEFVAGWLVNPWFLEFIPSYPRIIPLKRVTLHGVAP